MFFIKWHNYCKPQNTTKAMVKKSTNTSGNVQENYSQSIQRTLQDFSAGCTTRNTTLIERYLLERFYKVSK